MSDEVCGASGPGDCVCTRHGSDHTAHVTYREIDGQLTRIEWFACNPLGEPKDE